MSTFKAFMVREMEDGRHVHAIEARDMDGLPDGDVRIRVAWSSLNYKDALSASGNRGVTRRYPHTPGIDAAGIVEESQDERFQVGDRVLVTGFDLGMNTAGGFGEYIRVPADWVVPLPDNLALKEAMMYGTAGFTAALSVWELIDAGITPDDGEVLVTGATGGVGSMAVALLARLGYAVVAASRKPDAADYLHALGASRVEASEDLLALPDKPLLPGKWAGSVDTVGGELLAATLRSIRSEGVVTCCGNVGGAELPLTIYPFILRGGRLIGIDSQNCVMPHRIEIWDILASEWRLPDLASMVTEIGLEALPDAVARILDGGCVGRYLVRVSPG